ncbi:Insulin-like growth factor binding protein, N-terminal [Pseudocohnilembus persalinus]|uniref:Insulin-like growth factor binding protein, N-terminal n=1 Tax=Pseudocohnilembus persalinus TaxID=266149 RepID=A0A0V0QT56_PSEPJ|nr:Insulin-like growth factor binding protein, N-terminal [Pseudocohnilembus persalinus]|eukprot:KRX05484.1 Insulin-like growth factor binding protein, N-terminal [Pseudocohnilembus persalinus]
MGNKKVYINFNMKALKNNPVVYCEYLVKNNEVNEAQIKTYNINDDIQPQIGEVCFSFDPSLKSYLDLNLEEFGEGMTIGAFFYWQQFSNMKNVQLFYFGDSDGDNLISIYYNIENSQIVVSYQVEGGQTNTYKFTSAIKYDIYIHYMFIFQTDGSCKFYKNFKEIKGEVSGSLSENQIPMAVRQFTYVGKAPENQSRQYFGGRVENIIAYNGVLTSTQIDCIKSNDVCDESLDFVSENNCQTCDNDSQTCTSCNTKANFVLEDNGSCGCDFGYEKSGKSCVAKDNIIPGVSQETIESASTGTKAVISSMVVSNPTMAITLIDTLSMIKYTTYLDYEFPNIIYVYFEIFSGMVNFDYMPALTPSNSNYQDPPNGFKKFDEDGYLFKNINSYIWLSFGCGICWYSMRKINDKIDYKNRNHPKLKQIFRKILQKFEYDIFFMGVVQSFLFTNICCLMTLRSLDIDNLLKGFAYISALLIVFLQFATIFAIFKLAKVYYTNTQVHGDPDIDEKDINELQNLIQKEKKNRGMINPDLDYEEDDEGDLIKSLGKKDSNQQGIEVIQEEEEENENLSQNSEETKRCSAGAAAENVKNIGKKQKKKGTKLSIPPANVSEEGDEKCSNSSLSKKSKKEGKKEESEEKKEKLSLFQLTFFQKNELLENPYVFYQFFKQTNFLFEDVQHDNLWQLNYQTIYCLRKFIYGWALVFLNENVTTAILIWMMMNIFMIWYFIKHKPQEFKRSYWNELTQEFWFFIIYMVVLIFSVTDQDNAEQRKLLSYIMMGFATLILIQDIFMSFYDTGYSIYEATCLKLRHAQTISIKNRKKKANENFIFNELDQIEKADKLKKKNINNKKNQIKI